jgi:hypothetical protein
MSQPPGQQPGPPPVPKYWRVSVSTGTAQPEGERRWLVLSRAGAFAYLSSELAPAGNAMAPCVYVVPENDSPEDAEALDMMPRFKLISADRAVLTGPQKGLHDTEYSGGPAGITMAPDSRDHIEAYPAPVNEPFTSKHFNCYLWSASRGAALVLTPAGRLVWDAKAQAGTVMNFGESAALTVWTIRPEKSA